MIKRRRRRGGRSRGRRGGKKERGVAPESPKNVSPSQILIHNVVCRER